MNVMHELVRHGKRHDTVAVYARIYIKIMASPISISPVLRRLLFFFFLVQHFYCNPTQSAAAAKEIALEKQSVMCYNT